MRGRFFFFFSSRRRHTRCSRDWSSDVCSSDLSEHIDRTIELIREHGCKPGLVFNPATPLEYLDYTLEKLDLVLIMSVNPGFGGQKFIPTALRKLTDARRRIETSGRAVRLEIDGGVKVDNIRSVAHAGADTFVAGSSAFASTD